MERFVEKVVGSYFFDNRAEVFGAAANFIRFDRFAGMRTLSMADVRYTLMAGAIVYRKSAAHSLSPENLLIRYSEEATDAPPQGTLQPLSRELLFWQMLLPELDACQPIRHLFLDLCSGCSVVTPSPFTGQKVSTRNAVVWALRPSYLPFQFEEAADFDYQRCSLMLHKIATFHASSLHLQTTDGTQFELLNATFAATAPLSSHVESLLPMLRRCLGPLRGDQQYEAADGRFRHAVTLLEQMLATFASSVNLPFERRQTPERCWVACHRDYGRHSVVFERDQAGEPAEMRIINCQSMGFASLGVDLAIPLFVELRGGDQGQLHSTLVAIYCSELKEHLGSACPSWLSVSSEIFKSIPYALYVLASRIVKAQAETQPETAYFQPTVWNEELIVGMYRYLIDAEFVWKLEFPLL